MNITIIINMSIIIITMITIKHGPNFNTTTTIIIIIIIIIITASNFSIANELFDFLHLGREHATRPRAILAYVNIWNGNIWEIINRMAPTSTPPPPPPPSSSSSSSLHPTSASPSNYSTSSASVENMLHVLVPFWPM
jgi:hypothetical protein